MVMQSQGQTWWQSVQPMQRGRSMVQTWKEASWRWPGTMLMQSTGQTTRQASQPVHMSSSRRASVLGSFFLAMSRVILGVDRRCRKLIYSPAFTPVLFRVLLHDEEQTGVNAGLYER